MTRRVSLTRYLVEQQRVDGRIPPQLRLLLEVVARACKRISFAVNKGELGEVMGTAGSENVQGEVQKKLDIIANETLIEANEWGGHLAAMASEEMEGIYVGAQPLPPGRIPADVSTPWTAPPTSTSTCPSAPSSACSRNPTDHPGVHDSDFMQPGTQQVAAGYCIYGPQTTLVLTVGDGVAMFTLDREQGSFILTEENVRSLKTPKNLPSTCPTCATGTHPMKRYIDECLAGEEGPRGKNFNMRWVAGHGGRCAPHPVPWRHLHVPRDKREPHKPGKLRLMYEANPMSWLIEQAGGAATNWPPAHSWKSSPPSCTSA